MRGHAGRCVSIEKGDTSGSVPSFSSSTVPSFTTTRADMDQLQLQLQQQLSQQWVRGEQRSAGASWRPVSECGGMAVDTHSLPVSFSRYSAPLGGGVLVKSGSAVRPPSTTFIPSSSQHANAPPAASLSSVVKPLPAAAAAKPVSQSHSGGPVKCVAISSAAAPSLLSSSTVGCSSPTVASQHVRSLDILFQLHCLMLY